MAEFITKIRTDEGDKQIDYSALANLPAINNNLLINSDFRSPINQRWKTTYSGGAANTTTDVMYTIDRWAKRNYGSTIIVGNGYVRFRCESEPADSGTKTYAFVQPIENPSMMFGKTYTISAKIKAINGSFMLGMWQGSKTGLVTEAISGSTACKEITTTGVHSITLTVDSAFSGDASVINVGFTQSSGQHKIGNYIDIEWVKLEQGNVATQYATRLRADEVNLCKRYYQYVNTYKMPFVIVSETEAVGTIPLGAGMRNTPSVTFDACTYLDTKTSTYVEPSACNLDTSYTTNHCVALKIGKNSASTFTIGNVIIGTMRAFFDAEIH